MKNTVRMVKPRLCNILFILRAHCQNDAALFQLQNILLKGGICFCCRRFMSNLNVLHTIIANDTAPKCIIQIQNKTFLIFPQEAFDDLRQAKRDFGNDIITHSEFIGIILKPIMPFEQSYTSCKPMQVMQKKIFMRHSIVSKISIEALYKPCQSIVFCGIQTAESCLIRKIHIVLDDDRGREFFRQFFPNPRKAPHLHTKFFFNLVIPITECWPLNDIDHTRKYDDDIRLKLI